MNQPDINKFSMLWVEKYRPSTLKEMVLSKENRSFFEDIALKKEIPHLLFTGDPGLGKTSLAKVLVRDVLDCQHLYINASDESGVDTIRNKVVNFAQTKSIDGKLKVVILDEVDGLSSVQAGAGKTSAQQALRNVMEEYSSNVRFILTANYVYKVIPALRSRCQEFDLTPPFDECAKRCIYILKKQKVTIIKESEDKISKLIKSCYPDLRKMINTLQKYTINNVLTIGEEASAAEFAQTIFDMLFVNKDNLEKIRKHIIKNEIQFNNDYQQLLRDLFETIFNSTLLFNIKRQAMLRVSEALYKHMIVLDKEINAYSCVLALSELIED